MHHIFSLFLLSIYTILEFVAYMPQIIQLIKTKSADDISLASWLTWIASDVCYLFYVLLESPEIGVVFIALMNLFFVVFVYTLTFYYQKFYRAKIR